MRAVTRAVFVLSLTAAVTLGAAVASASATTQPIKVVMEYVTVQIQRGSHRVLQRTASARRGSGSLRLSALHRGRYTLTVFATVNKRSVAVQKSFRVT